MRRAIGVSSYYNRKFQYIEDHKPAKIIYLPLQQKANAQPWYKRLAKWYDDNYEQVFEGTGAAIAFLTGFLLLGVVFVGLARSLGWWQQ